MLNKLGYTENCKTCEYLIFNVNNLKKGLCDRLEDSDFVFDVDLNNTGCIYGISGKKISSEEIEIRKEKARLNKENFLKALNKASEKTQGWPQWKRRMLII